MNLIKARAPLVVVCVGIALAAFQGRPVAAQAFFETGYVVTLEGDTLRGQIDNQEWIRSPAKIRFRSSEAKPARTFTPHQLSAFYVSGELYERRAVRVDETPLRAGKFVEQRPSARRDTVFLTAVVKGPLSLYAYQDERRHFYLEDRTGIRELVHHQYLTLRDGAKYRITEERYKEQIAHAAALNCSEVEAESVSYRLSALEDFTEACNRRGTPGSVQFVRELHPTVLRHELLAGMSRTNLSVGEVDFSPSRTLMFGYALAFERGGTHGRRAFLLGLHYRSIETQSPEQYGNVYDMSIQAHYLRASVGYRYQIRAGTWRPSVEADLAVATPLRYRAEGKRLRGWPRVEESVAFSNVNRFTPGAALGVGLAYRQLQATWKVERTFAITSTDFAFPFFTQLTLGYAF